MTGGGNRLAPQGYRPGASMPAAAANEMLALLSAGNWGPLEARARDAAKRHPRHFFGWKMLGTVLAATRRLPESAEAFAQAALLAPGDAMIHNNLGGVLSDLGRFAEAEASLGRALAIKPDLGMAWSNLANALRGQGRLGEAEQGYRRAAALEPGSPEPLAILANALRDLGKLEEAEASLRRALAIAPGYADAWSLFGEVLAEGGKREEAADAYRRAVALQPGRAEAHCNLGGSLDRLGRHEEAETSFRRAIALKPDFALAHNRLGNALFALRRLEEAEQAFRCALALEPGSSEALCNLGICLPHLGRAEEGSDAVEEALRLEPDHIGALTEAATMAVYRDDVGNDQLKAVRLRYAAELGKKVEPLPAPGRTGHSGKLRIGYLSADFRHHAVARNLLPVLSRHDKSAFEVHCYAQIEAPDVLTAKFRGHADGWHDITLLDDAEAARRIRDDGIDILVSVAGTFDLNRPRICAYRPAPVQISLHDSTTSGLPEMDYILVDRFLVPGGSREFLTERPLRLPNYYIAEFPGGLPVAKDDFGDGPPTFASFNNPVKITPTALALWGRILAAMPEARLLLKYMNVYANPALRTRFLDGLIEAGAEAEQVIFVTEADSPQAHFERYRDIDVALDTFPFSGSTTSLEAFAMGMPVVTWPWDRMAGRWTLGMLRALRLPELVAHSGDEYVAIALDVARNRAAWRARRQEISDALAASSLCNGALRARQMERLYRAVWNRFVKERSPQSQTHGGQAHED